MIAIIDYGMGNIHSVQKALEIKGGKTLVTAEAGQIKQAGALVLPGVGAFDEAVLALEEHGLKEAIIEQIKNKKPFLGICLGMQLLFEKSDEAGQTRGLSVLKGEVKRLPEKPGLKVPHMGWNQLRQTDNTCPLLKNLSDSPQVYFCHSYYPLPQDSRVIAATTDYGVDFAAAVWKDNIYGVQFHPEKSQAVGLKILENFVNLC